VRDPPVHSGYLGPLPPSPRTECYAARTRRRGRTARGRRPGRSPPAHGDRADRVARGERCSEFDCRATRRSRTGDLL